MISVNCWSMAGWADSISMSAAFGGADAAHLPIDGDDVFDGGAFEVVLGAEAVEIAVEDACRIPAGPRRGAGGLRR